MAKKKKEEESSKEPLNPKGMGFNEILGRLAQTNPNEIGLASGLPIAQFGATNKPLHIAEFDFQVFVLSDKKRVISQRSMYRFLGIRRGGATGKYVEMAGGGGARLARFLESKAIKPLISSELGVALNSPIEYLVGKVKYLGYEATLLQKIIRAISKAYLKGQLPPELVEIGRRAEVVDDGLSLVGISALIDEVTGYQYVRDRDALEKVLAEYIKGTLGNWARRFPQEFYELMFQLNGWTFNAENITKRPGVVGSWTKEFIYKRLPPGVLAVLEEKNPASAKWQRPNKHHQWLTEDIGHRDLEIVIRNAMAIMKASRNWKEFERLYNKAYPLPGQSTQMELGF